MIVTCVTHQLYHHCVHECGDGVREGIEECDDGNNDDMDGCDTNCFLVLQEDYICSETESNITICVVRPDPVILNISKTGKTPDVVILFRDQSQFFLGDLNIKVRKSTLNNVRCTFATGCSLYVCNSTSCYSSILAV